MSLVYCNFDTPFFEFFPVFLDKFLGILNIVLFNPIHLPSSLKTGSTQGIRSYQSAENDKISKETPTRLYRVHTGFNKITRTASSAKVMLMFAKRTDFFSLRRRRIIDFYTKKLLNCQLTIIEMRVEISVFLESLRPQLSRPCKIRSLCVHTLSQSQQTSSESHRHHVRNAWRFTTGTLEISEKTFRPSAKNECKIT